MHRSRLYGLKHRSLCIVCSERLDLCQIRWIRAIHKQNYLQQVDRLHWKWLWRHSVHIWLPNGYYGICWRRFIFVLWGGSSRFQIHNGASKNRRYCNTWLHYPLSTIFSSKQLRNLFFSSVWINFSGENWRDAMCDYFTWSIGSNRSNDKLWQFSFANGT